MRKVSVMILLSLFLLIIILIATEICFRLFNRQITYEDFLYPYDFHCFEKGTYYPIRMKSDTDCMLKSNNGSFRDVVIRTNSLGLRNSEVVIPKPPGTIRILVLGDSFTQGWGVSDDEAYPRELEKILKEKYPDKKIEVVNAGLATSGPNYYYLYYKNEAYKFDADLIIVGFNMLNDVSDNAYFTKWADADADGLPTKVEHTNFVDSGGNFVPYDVPFKFKIPLLRNLHIFAYLADRLVPFKEEFDVGKIYLPRSCFYKKNCHDLDGAKETTKKDFLGMKKLTDEEGKKLVFIEIPTELQFDKKARLKYGIDLPLLPIDKEYPYEYFGQFFRDNNLEYFDLRPGLKNYDPYDLYFAMDDHWTPLGHRVAAETIANKLGEYIK